MYSMASSYLRQWNGSFLVFHYPNTPTARFICKFSTPLGISKFKSTDGKIQANPSSLNPCLASQILLHFNTFDLGITVQFRFSPIRVRGRFETKVCLSPVYLLCIYGKHGFLLDFSRNSLSKPRNVTVHATEPRSWFGPNGQYIRELPCPSCRGRGYTPCRECGIERSRSDCSQCGGKVHNLYQSELGSQLLLRSPNSFDCVSKNRINESNIPN